MTVEILYEVYKEVNDRFLREYSPIIYENYIALEEIPYYEKHLFVTNLLKDLNSNLDLCDDIAIYIMQAENKGISTYHIEQQRKELIIQGYTLLQLVYEYLKEPQKNFASLLKFYYSII